MTETTHHDVIIIGAGAAGLSAGLVLARARASVLLLDAGEPRNAPAAHMHGFLSRDGMAPVEFLAVGRREAAASGAAIEPATVRGIERRDDGGFDVTLAGGTVEVARTLLVATGLKDELPGIPGVSERWGALVHHCPYCHGYEVRERSIGVIGGAAREMSLKQAGLLRRYSDRVTLLTNGIELTPPERHYLDAFGIRVVDGTVSRLSGEVDGPVAVSLDDGHSLECEAVFIAPVPRPTDDLLRSLGCEEDPHTGLVAVDAAGQTSVPGVWPRAMSSRRAPRSSPRPAPEARAPWRSTDGCSSRTSSPHPPAGNPPDRARFTTTVKSQPLQHQRREQPCPFLSRTRATPRQRPRPCTSGR